MGPIAFIPTRPLHSDAQATVATTFALMTACVQAASAEERDAAAEQVAENLLVLADAEGLDEEFRRLCGRLHAIWSATP